MSFFYFGIGQFIWPLNLNNEYIPLIHFLLEVVYAYMQPVSGFFFCRGILFCKLYYYIFFLFSIKVMIKILELTFRFSRKLLNGNLNFFFMIYFYLFILYLYYRSGPENFKKSRPKKLVKSNKSISRKKFF